MKTILRASAVTLGLAIGTAFAASAPNGGVSADAELARVETTTLLLNSIGTPPAAHRPYVDTVAPSWSNPTGQVIHGPRGTISLFAPTGNGSG
jgi:hypothetical protein